MCSRFLSLFTGSAVIFEDYRNFVMAGRDNNPPTLVCYHPHGIISVGLFHLFPLPELDGFRVMAAPVLLSISPLFRWEAQAQSVYTDTQYIRHCSLSHFRWLFNYGYIRLGSANRQSFIQSMKDQESMILVPGGLHEATLAEYGKEQLFIKNRKGDRKTRMQYSEAVRREADVLLVCFSGFVRYSLQHGYSITPVYGFGECIHYHQWKAESCRKIKLWLNNYGICTVFPYGHLFWPIGIFPKRYV